MTATVAQVIPIPRPRGTASTERGALAMVEAIAARLAELGLGLELKD
jgi:hypothetical protein